MHRQVLDEIGAVRRAIYGRCTAQAGELARCAHRVLGAMPDAEQWPELLDFFAIEWVDGDGWTQVERAVHEGIAPAESLRWPREVQNSLWVVDGWDGDRVLLRDVETEAETAVTAPGLQNELTRRTVLRARVVPWHGAQHFSGEPDVYGEMGVIARMDLLQAWRESGAPALGAELASLRAGFLRQREERAAFIEHFGADEVVFADAAAMEQALDRFADFLFFTFRPPSMGGHTRAEAHRLRHGDAPSVGFKLGESLAGPGRPGAIYDAVEGVHFLPMYGEFCDTLRGLAGEEGLVRRYLEEPGVTRLPFHRVGETTRLAALTGQPEAPMDTLLDAYKPRIAAHTPNVLPGIED